MRESKSLLFNPEISVLNQKRNPYNKNLISETPGDSEKRNNRSCVNFTWTMCACFERSCHPHLSAAAGTPALGLYHAKVSPIGVELRRL